MKKKRKPAKHTGNVRSLNWRLASLKGCILCFHVFIEGWRVKVQNKEKKKDVYEKTKKGSGGSGTAKSIKVQAEHDGGVHIMLDHNAVVCRCREIVVLLS